MNVCELNEISMKGMFYFEKLVESIKKKESYIST